MGKAHLNHIQAYARHFDIQKIFSIIDLLGVQCQEIREYPYYRCGSCPSGFTGNGSACYDIDEVKSIVLVLFHNFNPFDVTVRLSRAM